MGKASFEEIVEDPHLRLSERKIVAIFGGEQTAEFLIALLDKDGLHESFCLREYVVKAPANLLGCALAMTI